MMKTSHPTVPRYTSYPTAAEFSPIVSSNDAQAYSRALTKEQSLSLYVHIPYCRQLCWFCGCHTKVINHDRPVQHYLKYLAKEISLHKSPAQVNHLHFGGGSPTVIEALDFLNLVKTLRTQFEFQDEMEIAIEVDPRSTSPKKIGAYAQAGINRASLGVQDFDLEVQKAINRVQDFSLVSNVVNNFRKEGIHALNLDLIYGLPLQTKSTLARTIDLAHQLQPDRLSLFGYAHLPQRIKHQNLIKEEDLPNANSRTELVNFCREELLRLGYVEIGIDHFAKPDDPLAKASKTGTLMRNFQGYTTDRADALLGLGVSSISNFPDGYLQNTTDMIAYTKALDEGNMPVVRGIKLTDEDKARREIIMDLMCFLQANVDLEKFPYAQENLKPYLEKGLAIYDQNILKLPSNARNEVRLIASCFDQYFQKTDIRFSQAV